MAGEKLGKHSTQNDSETDPVDTSNESGANNLQVQAREYAAARGARPQDRISVLFQEKEVNDKGGLPTTISVPTAVWIKDDGNETALPNLGDIPPFPIINIGPTEAITAPSTEKVLFDVTDIQFGYRMLDNGLMIPTHLPEGLDIMLQVLRDVQPDRVLYGGDEADYAELSHFTVDSAHYNAYSLSASIRGLSMFLGKSVAQAPNARHTNIPSNHGDRPEKFIREKAPMLTGLVPATKGNTRGYPANSYPMLAGLEDLGIEYTGGYRANLEKINDRLFTVHGDTSNARGSTAHRYLSQLDSGMSMMFHHTHRHEEAHNRRRWNALGARGLSSTAFSNGCLADINGAVPGHNSAVSPTGGIQGNRENWINGFGVVEYQEGNKPFNNNFVEINQDDEGYYAYFDGKVYRPLGPQLMPEAGYAYEFGKGPFDAEIVDQPEFVYKQG